MLHLIAKAQDIELTHDPKDPYFQKEAKEITPEFLEACHSQIKQRNGVYKYYKGPL